MSIDRLKSRPAQIAIIAWVVLTAIFWGNLFRFHPAMIDQSYDDTSEGLVIGRMARASAQGLFTHTDLGSNIDPKHRTPVGDEYYNEQIGYFEHPDLVHNLGLVWAPYPSHFGLQGFVFSIIDLLNPLPRHGRIGFYHLLASLFAAGTLVWIATILRSRFGWPAFFGFLFPITLEPMFSALAPSLYWVVGIWFVPMALAMLLADEAEARRRVAWIALAFLAFLAKFLSGYEFTSTIIMAAAVGCLLGVKERPDPFRQVLANASLVIGAGVLAFATAAALHAAKQDGFAVFMQKAAMRMTGDATSLEDELILGKFATISSVLWTYLGGNFITLIKNFGFLLALIGAYAVLILLDERFNWFYGAGRRKLQILALAVVASFTAPLSWFVLAKGHSYDHPPIDLIMWYVPTIPLGFAMLATAAACFREYLGLKQGDAMRSWLAASMPVIIIAAAIAIRVVDRRIETTGTWVIAEHTKAVPIFDSEPLGIEFRMSNQWFTVLYRCPKSPADPDTTFLISAEQDNAPVQYDFSMEKNQVFAQKGRCIAAQAKSDRPVSRIHFGETSKQHVSWERDATISLPDKFKLETLSNADWDRGIARESGTDLLVSNDDFGPLLIKRGDEVQVSPTDRRTITSITSVGLSKLLKLDGAPIHLPDGVSPVFGIVRR